VRMLGLEKNAGAVAATKTQTHTDDNSVGCAVTMISETADEA